jgi:hypothetical protein
LNRSRRFLIVVACALVVAACWAPAAPAASFTRSDVAALTNELLARWPARQNPNGTFRDFHHVSDARGRSRDYDEALMGAVLLRQGLATKNPAMTQSALKAIAREADPKRYGRPGVFQVYAMAVAYRDARSAGLLRRKANRRLAERWPRWLAKYRRVRMSPYRPFSNQRTVEAAAYRLLLASGIRSHTAGAVLADRRRAAGELRAFDALVSDTAAHYSRKGVAVFSDTPRNPLAYVALTSAFLARYVATGGPGKARFLQLARGMLALTGPDGDIAYAGRSQGQSWALSLGAYAALQAANWEPSTTRRGQFRALAASYLQRLKVLHQPAGQHWITPVFRWFRIRRAQISTSTLFSPVTANPRHSSLIAGVDTYSGAVVYQALAALGLQWTQALLKGTISSSSATPLTGRVLSRGRSQMVTLRRETSWAAVKASPSWLGFRKVDLRADAGLMRLKVRRADGWVDLLALAPRTYGETPDSLAPRLVAGSRRYVPRGRIASVRSASVTLRIAYGNRAATLRVGLTADGAVIALTGAPRARYRFGVVRYRTVTDKPTKLGLATETARHRFEPAPRVIRRGPAMASAEAMLRRYDVDVVAGSSGRVRWTIEPR